MKTEDILDLDLRNEEAQEIVQKVLRKIKPLSNYDMSENIPMEKLETLVAKMCTKYCIMIQFITATYMDDDVVYYSCSFKTTDVHKWLGNVYAHNMYELFAKASIKIYSDIKKLNIPERNWDEYRAEKQRKLIELSKGAKK